MTTAQEFWDQRLNEQFDLRGTGGRPLGRYNELLPPAP